MRQLSGLFTLFGGQEYKVRNGIDEPLLDRNAVTHYLFEEDVADDLKEVTRSQKE